MEVGIASFHLSYLWPISWNHYMSKNVITLYSVFCCLASGSLCRWLALAESSLISSSWVFHILTTPVLYLQCTKYCNWSKHYRLNSEEFAKVSLRKYLIELSHSNSILTIFFKSDLQFYLAPQCYWREELTCDLYTFSKRKANHIIANDWN